VSSNKHVIKTTQAASSSNSPSRGEICAWASYDIANSTYGTIVATAVYNAYFISVVAGRTPGIDHGLATLLLTFVISAASLLVVATAPVIGAIADATASKKRLLLCSTGICVVATASLSLAGPGMVSLAIPILLIATVAFGTGEDLIAAFLPELASKNDMGKISAFGWAAGYIGGILSLGTCFAYMQKSQAIGQTATHFVPVVLVICAAFYAFASIPTFVFLRERAKPDPAALGQNHIRIGFARLWQTIQQARVYGDLFSFLLALFVYSCGTTTIIHLASVYAQEVMGFKTIDSVTLILVVNLTAAIGAAFFGFLQDRMGSIKTLAIALAIWIVAISLAIFSQSKFDFWIAANLIGVALGASGSVGRAVVAQFSPPGRSGEFLGLWGLAVKLATACGALSFGLVTYLTHNNYRLGLVTTLSFFLIGLLLLTRVNEKRGRLAANEIIPTDDEPELAKA
jgi:UMF1 family MFS transporter